MKNYFAIALASGLLLAACSKSLDERFEEACEEDRAEGGELVKACQHSEYLPPEDKEQLLQMREAVHDQRAKVDALKEEGRDQGYLEE